MDKDKIKKTLTGAKVTDYSYAIIFFLTFSFFAFFVIRPNLVNVFALQEELGRLHILDQGYENVIRRIVDIQSFLEANRSDLYLLDESIPSSPNISGLVDDVNRAASTSGLVVDEIDISKVNLKQTGEKNKRSILTVNLGTSSEFEAAKVFKDSLELQRRLKLLKRIQLQRGDQTSSTSGSLDVKLEVEGFFL
jgi:Tfp pilus assembly protein PilO